MNHNKDIARYKNGKHHGYQKLHYNSGNPMLEGYCIDGKMVGVFLSYSDNGIIKSKEYYI